jgi:hypothetical protein
MSTKLKRKSFYYWLYKLKGKRASISSYKWKNSKLFVIGIGFNKRAF